MSDNQRPTRSEMAKKIREYEQQQAGNNDNRKPTIDELNKQIEREAAARLRRALDRATGKTNAEYSKKRQEWLAFYGFRLDQENDDMATPSPDWNDGKESDYE